jgi:anti-sigma factor RsiW
MSRARILRYLKTAEACSCDVATDDFRALAACHLSDERKLRLARHVVECAHCQSLLAALVMIIGVGRALRNGMVGVVFKKPGPPPQRAKA